MAIKIDKKKQESANFGQAASSATDNFDFVKIYEIAVNIKHNIQHSRDEINKYYTTLFTAIISMIFFFNKVLGGGDAQDGASQPDNSTSMLMPILMAIMGLAPSISWLLTLKRIHSYMQGIDQFLLNLEMNNQSEHRVDGPGHQVNLFTFMNSYLTQVNSPASVTKQEFLVPYTFIAIFILTIIISLIV